MNSSHKRVEFLDYLRGIAILAVLFFHTLSHAFGYDELPWSGWLRGFSVHTSFLWLLPFCYGGKAGVAIFFVVSGFCIHMSFQQQGQRWGGFFIRRFFRIYPPYLAALIFSIIVILSYSRLDFQGWEVWRQWLTHLFLVHNASPQTLISINSPFWSLAVEAQLYALYPFLLMVAAKLGWHRAMFIAAACELAIRGTEGFIQTVNATETVGGRICWLLSFSPLGFWFSWAIGAFAADAYLKGRPLPFLGTSPILWLGLAAVSYFVKPLDFFQFLFFALATATVISRLLAGNSPKIKVPRLAVLALKKIGLWSYSIYLLHQPLLNTFTLAVVWAVSPSSFPPPIMYVLIVFTWLPIIAMSFLWHELFELPAIALGKKIIQKIEANDTIAFRPNRPGNNVAGNPAIFPLMVVVLLVLVIGSLFINAKLTPPDPKTNNNRAWSLATNPDATKRNGALAVQLAEDACQRTQYKETIMVGTLAAAYAEAGRYDEAARTAQQACELAVKNGETNLLQRNQELLTLYQNHQPYRERRVEGGN
jgi:peptidoglycan/LPS O-acetylase OafA/YrhL